MYKYKCILAIICTPVFHAEFSHPSIPSRVKQTNNIKQPTNVNQPNQTPPVAPVPLPNHPMRWDWPWVHPVLGAHLARRGSPSNQRPQRGGCGNDVRSQGFWAQLMVGEVAGTGNGQETPHVYIRYVMEKLQLIQYFGDILFKIIQNSDDLWWLRLFLGMLDGHREMWAPNPSSKHTKWPAVCHDRSQYRLLNSLDVASILPWSPTFHGHSLGIRRY